MTDLRILSIKNALGFGSPTMN